MLARDTKREVDRLELVAADDLGDMREPAVEELLHLGARRERRVVVEVDVEDDGDPWPQRFDRAIGLVALDDEHPFAGPDVAAELRHLAADQEGRIAAEA